MELIHYHYYKGYIYRYLDQKSFYPKVLGLQGHFPKSNKVAHQNWSLEFHGLVCRADNFTKKPKNLSKTVDITAK